MAVNVLLTSVKDSRFDILLNVTDNTFGKLYPDTKFASDSPNKNILPFNITVYSPGLA